MLGEVVTISSKIKNWLSEPSVSLGTTWGFAVIGVLLRLRRFLFDRSLWLDESYLALNITNRSPIELFSQLDYNQGAPVGFLLLEKLATILFGSSEMALRLVPLVSGIVSIFLLRTVASRFLEPNAVPIAVGLFAILDPLIYYSSEVKQYSSDVAVALSLYLLADSLLVAPLHLKRTVVLSSLAGIGIWFSHPAVFILAGSGITLLLISLRNKDRRSLLLLSVTGAIWLTSFLISYFVSIRGLSANPKLLAYWQDAFPPFSSSLGGIAHWFIDSFFGLFSYPVGLQMTGIAAVALLVGGCTLFGENRSRFILLSATVAFTLLASTLHRYPFRGRLLLFLVPTVILLIASGLGTIQTKTREPFPLLSILLIAFLFFHPALNAFVCFINPPRFEEIKPVIQYVAKHRMSGDILYLYYASEKPFEYYSERHLIEPMDKIVGSYSRENWNLFRDDLDKLRGNMRVWILFSHVFPSSGDAHSSAPGFDEERLFLDYLDHLGKRMDCSRAVGASVYLYDLRGRTNSD